MGGIINVCVLYGEAVAEQCANIECSPEDKNNITDTQSFSDRIVYIKIPYVLDFNTEAKIYKNVFGNQIENAFLPRVLQNFAKVIISSRLNLKSDSLLEWIDKPEKYALYCDSNLQLLKMDIYTGHIPTWLSDEDRKKFTVFICHFSSFCLHK